MIENKINENNMEKIVVCITAQSNSKRLIDKGADIAEECGAEFHILHVQKGDNIFNNHETLRQLQQLMVYGSSKGGIVHAFCDNDIAACIGAFAKGKGITKVVMGEQPTNPAASTTGKKRRESQFQRILDQLPSGVDVMIIGKEVKQVQLPKKKRIV